MKGLLAKLGLLIGGLLLLLQTSKSDNATIDQKIRGMHIFGRGEKSDEGFDRLVANNVEWVVQVPYAYQRTNDSPNIRHAKKDSIGQWSRRDSSFIRLAKKAKTRELRIVMKPHLWMSNAGADEWRNAINFNNEDDWTTWETNYRNMIMHYAEMATAYDMEILCIGVEMKSTVQAREAFWRALIQDVRKIYKGKITYGANWYEEYKEVPFWDALDYIGVQAYFPVAQADHPSIDDIKKGWQPYLRELKALSDQYEKPILFTEIGYKNTADGATTPWEWPEHLDDPMTEVSDTTQYNAYEGFFEVVWDQKWFAGALFWQWRVTSRNENRSKVSFSPENRVAEESLARGFGTR